MGKTMQLDSILGLIPRMETRPDGQYAVYSDSDGLDVFSINIDLANSFQQTVEERTRGIELCIKARVVGGWRGDILNPVPWLPMRNHAGIKERYERIAQSEWFREAYENRPAGETMEIKDFIVIGTTGPDKEVTYDIFRNQVIAVLLESLDGCSTEEDVLKRIGSLADDIKSIWDDGDSVEIAVDYILDGLQGE